MAETQTTAAARKSGAFLSDATLELTGGFRRTWFAKRYERRLVAPIVFELGAPGSGLIIYVPAGYITDGFSMPGTLLQLFQPHSARYLLPSILHDWLYDTGLVSRGIADAVLLQAMRAVGAAGWQAKLVYFAVRLGGWGGFGKPMPENLDIVDAAPGLGVGEAIVAYLATLKNPERKSDV